MKRILVIEGDAAMRALVQEWLSAAGHAIELCDLENTVAQHRPSVIVASMINLRGPGAIELQHLRGKYPNVPVVVLSGQLAHSLATGSETAMSLGVSALLAKPFTRAELLGAVAAALLYGH
ncbi:MAG: response regulator [Rhodoferax sp.]|nr:response regulator [Rhodoferax sp.]